MGVDTLDLMYQVAWDAEAFASTMAALEEAKEAATADDAQLAQTAITLGDAVWHCRPMGALLGKGHGPFMRFQLEHAGMVLQLARQDEPSGDMPNVALHLGQIACLAAGDFDTLKARARAAIDALGVRVQSEKVSRVDFFGDLEGQASEPIVWDFLHGHRVMRLNRGKSDGMEFETFDEPAVGGACSTTGTRFQIFTTGLRMQGFRVGTGSCFRVYDKVAEIGPQALKRATWEAVEWDGNAPEVCTRFEFQLRRAFLKDRGIDTLDDLGEKMGALLAYLAGNGDTEDRAWIRFTDAPPDRTNTTRAKSADYWRRLQDAFARHTPTANKITRAKKRRPAKEHLLMMAAGCLEMAAALDGADLECVDDFAGYMVEQIYAHLGVRSFARSIDEKKRRLKNMVADFPEPNTDAGGAGIWPPPRAHSEEILI